MASAGSLKIPDFTATPPPEYYSSKMAAMWQCQQDGHLTDIIIKVKDTSIHCHKIVLSVGCDYFAKILTPEFKEGQISMETAIPNVMSSIIKYFYGQPVTFDVESLSDLLEAVKHLGLNDLKDQLIKFMSENTSIEVAVCWWKLSEKYKMEEVRKTAVKMIASDVAKVGASDEFKQLSIDELLSVVQDDNLELESRDQLLMNCIEWVDYEPLARKESVVHIFKKIMIEKCSLEMLNTIYKKYRDIIDHKTVYSYILDEMFRRTCQAKEMSVHSKPNMHLVALGGMEQGWQSTVNRKCFVADQLDTLQWNQFAEIPADAVSKQSPIVCLNDGFIVLSGGTSQSKTNKYDAKAKIWVTLLDTPEPRSDASAVVCDNSVYLLGGSGPLASVFRLDLASLTWHKEADMLEKQQWPISTSLDTTVYVVFNDFNKSGTCGSLQMFDCSTNKLWQYKSSLPKFAPRTNGSSIVSADDTLYLVGGHERIAAKYKVSTDTWSLLKQPSIMHSYGSAALLRHKIYLVGHENRDHLNASVYDLEKDEWSTMPVNLPTEEISFFKAAVVTWI